MQIEEKSPFASPFEWIGGETRVHALVERFYDLMDLEPAYSDLRAVHGSSLDNARQRLFW
ncbi:MAG TPA: globin, partial [Variovorax sp.]